jgi:hypothetical protein
MILVDPDGFLFSSSIDGSIAAMFNTRLGLLLGSHTQIPHEFLNLTMQYAKNKNIPESLNDRELNGFFITGRVDLIDVPVESVTIPPVYASGGASAGFDARLLMDFSRNGDAAFGFDALAFAGVMVTFGLLAPPPPPCLELEICLAAEAQLMISTLLSYTGGNWNFEGTGCGSLNFSSSICGVSFEIGGKAMITLSTQSGTNVDATLGETCSGGSSEFVCE